MMKNKIQHMLVGLFVLGLGATFIAGILWLGAGGPGRDYRIYAVYMAESVAGLSRDGAVKYRGVDVGRIREIHLAPDNPELVRLLLEIEVDTPVKQDTVATLEAQGLTGLAYINLLGGSRAAPALSAEPGQDYPVIPSRPSVWGRLDRSLGELVDNLIEASKQLKSLLSDDNQQLLTQTFGNLNTLTAAMAGRADTVEAALDDLAAALHNARDASVGLPGLVTQLQNSAVALEGMANEIATTGSELRASVRAGSGDLARFTDTALPEVAVMTQELRRAAENFRRLSESLQRDPSILLRGTSAPQPGPGE